RLDGSCGRYALVRSRTAGSFPHGAGQGRGLHFHLPAVLLSGPEPPAGLEQHVVPERLDAERVVGTAGNADGNIEAGRGRESRRVRVAIAPGRQYESGRI